MDEKKILKGPVGVDEKGIVMDVGTAVMEAVEHLCVVLENIERDLQILAILYRNERREAGAVAPDEFTDLDEREEDDEEDPHESNKQNK